MIPLGRLPVPVDVARRVDDAEYARLLGYRDRRIPAGRAARRAQESRDWFADSARPWALAAAVALDAPAAPETRLANGEALTSRLLARRLEESEATGLLFAALSAGAAVDERTGRLWAEERPDEAYFLDRLAAAAVEHLAGWAGRHLRDLARDRALDLLPGYGPGHDGWDLAEQTTVARCLTANGGAPPPPSFEVLPTGMIRPKTSLLTTFALTPRTDLAEAAWQRTPCSWCSLTSCGFRRIQLTPS